MPSPRSASSTPLYRLRGAADGQSLVFDIGAGEHTVGSQRESDLRLAVAGVSRRHAAILATDQGMVVEDLASKNGTFVDGQRVTRAAVPPGARLTIGPVEVTVERLSEDAALAISFDDSGSIANSPSNLQVSETAVRVAHDERSDPALEVVEGMAERLAGPPSEALAYLTGALQLDGIALVEWCQDDEPVAVASWGELGEIPSLAQIRDLDHYDARGGSWRLGASADRHMVLAVWLSDGADIAPLALVCWRSDCEGEKISGHLLRVVFRLLVLSHLDGSDAAALQPNKEAPPLCFPDGYLPGRSEPLRELYRQMAHLVGTRRPVLLHGDTGVGKEMLARTLHLSSAKPDAPYVVVNCAAIPDNLLESEMFGIVKGAASGIEPRRGYFSQADGGTLFLDEIGELSPALQAKLLRALQEREIQPVGGRTRSVDVWVVAATNLDLGSENLRRDLYYRLAGGLLQVPPLRNCVEDLPALLRHFLIRAAADQGVRLRGVTARGLRRLAAYPWPGNVRELEQLVYRVVAGRPEGGVIDEDHLPQHVRRPRDSPQERLAPSELDDLSLKPRVEALERQLIIEAMRRSAGRQVAAAKLLGISRSGLAKKLHRLELKDSWTRTGEEPIAPIESLD